MEPTLAWTAAPPVPDAARVSAAARIKLKTSPIRINPNAMIPPVRTIAADIATSPVVSAPIIDPATVRRQS